MHIKSLAKHSLIVSTAFMLICSSLLPVVSYADNSSSQTCTPPANTQTGIHSPQGADAKTYTYNCTTGLWQNQYYTYDPSTGLVTPINPVVYTYDPTTGMYDYSIWTYDAPTSSYVAVSESISQPPTGADIVGGPVAPTPQSAGSDSISNTGPNSNNTIGTNPGTGNQLISDTGPNSNNSLGGTSTNNDTTNNQNTATVNNLLNQDATTGDALVIGNTTGGSAASGNAQDLENVVNMLQSSSNALGNNTVTFVANINGDVNGNLLLDPSTLNDVQPATSTEGDGTTNNLTVNNQTNSAINNNINLAANSGNATVANNTTGGNATSGSATAIADVVNLIDSEITSGKSFVGVININGDLNGDILVPQNLINQLVASNVPQVNINETGPNSNNSVDGNNTTNTTNVTNTNNEGINNNVNLSAASGQASVTNNTSGGNATTGNASTNLTAFNLTGSNILGSNDLLVFVNVLGTWVGMIVNAPAGATAAELGGGITSNTQNGANNNTTVNNSNDQQINNNITGSAKSGDASVDSNTQGGNATSGNADTAVNLLNVENSNLSLSGWFGILFINVLGTWHGNFGIEQSPGDSISNTGPGSSNSVNAGSNSKVPAQVQVFRFAPKNGSSNTSNGSITTYSNGNSSGNGQTTNGSRLAAQISTTTSPTPKLTSVHRDLLFPIIAVILFTLYVFGDRMYSRRQKAAQSASESKIIDVDDISI